VAYKFVQKFLPNRKGFTFIEMIVAVAVLVFIMIGIVVVYRNYTSVYEYQEATVKVSGSARVAANELQKIALQADKIATSHDFSGHNYSSDQHTLVLEIPSVDSSGHVVSGKYDYAVIYLTGSDLYRRIEADAASDRSSGITRLSEAVSSLDFTYNDANLDLANKIDMDLRTETSSRGQTISYRLTREIFLRNK
jgi:prepilin-type N-terminal cleavage/methylation domain-containing protein